MSNQSPHDEFSPLEILFRNARSPQEQRVLRRIVQDWSLHDPNSYPAQLAVITLSQWQAAASVPLEVERLLGIYENILIQTGANIDQSFLDRLEQLVFVQQAFEESAQRMEERARELEGETTRLRQTAQEGEMHLKKLVSSFEYIQREAYKDQCERVEERITRLWRWAVGSTTLLIVAVLILAWIWAAHHFSSTQTQGDAPQQTVQAP